MASSYSPSLRIELIGTGDQSGLWGDTTNNNLGDLIEQAITGVDSIPMLDVDYTLSALNGSTDEARNAVIIMTSAVSLTGSRNVFIPAEEKLYVFKNSTTGGQNLVVKTSGGTGVTVPNGASMLVYCDGTNCAQQLTYLDTPTIATPTISNANLTGTPVAPTAASGTNTTQLATTAFVTTAVSNAFPSGTKLMFAQASAPTGWTQVTDDSANNRMLRVVSSTGAGTGGTASPILNNVVPAHTHTFTSGTESQGHTHSGTTGTESAGHTHTFGAQTGGQSASHTHTTTIRYMGGTGTGGTNVDLQGGGGSSVNVSGYDSMSGASSDHSHYVSGTTSGISANHTHTITTGGVSANHTHSGTTDNGSSQTNWAPRYIDMILCSKN